ncbi:isopenicillin-N N-acyltransferase-like protein [Nonomuraea polychroma]|uniref:Isopenicillin-N N-acyltransferase-like protein n=1 Tax=Nonomuraea polychroma TaxID=46176 RepID=A0A438MMH2_9ACTN|nr:C45 family peptidase [Nonomuraea polychroma]RVX46825.1 isopenicillin-N N-acyltransferase-like protein [Nonomuraea polychroma]
MSLTSLPLVEISGGPRERGRQYGEQARDRVQRALAYYAEAFAFSSGLTWEQVVGRAARWVEPSKAFAPELVEEMEGIAEGAGVGFLDVLALNARGEIIYDTTFSSMEPDGCTSFALLGEASGDGHVYAGQNWDWRHGVSDTLMVLRVVQPGRPTVIMHVEAGQVGRQGANSAGIALNANGLGGRFDDSVGVPQTLIRRRVLDSDNLNAALEALTKSRAHIASNALVTHREGFAIDLETTPGAVGWMYPSNGLLVHGNHYQAFVPPQLAATYRPSSADSLFRVPRAEGGLRLVREASGTDEARKRIRAAMSDHLGHPESLCTHPDPTQPAVKRWATLLSSCVDLTTGDYLIAAGTPCDHEYERVPWNLYDGPHGEVTP